MKQTKYGSDFKIHRSTQRTVSMLALSTALMKWVSSIKKADRQLLQVVQGTICSCTCPFLGLPFSMTVRL